MVLTRGYLSVVRLTNGQIFDEYRLVSDKGETLFTTNSVRAYNAVLDRWEIISTDQENGLQDFGAGHFENGEMHIEQKFGQTDQNRALLRIRYHDIRPDGFLWNADRSLDGGKSWEKDNVRFEARRIGPSRSLELTPPKSASTAPTK